MSGSGQGRAFARLKEAAKGVRLNTLHRYVGIILAPFLVLQTVSGLLLRLARVGPSVSEEGIGAPLNAWHQLLVRIHIGPGLLSTTYQLLLAAGVLWMAVSGWILYLRIRRGRNRRPSA